MKDIFVKIFSKIFCLKYFIKINFERTTSQVPNILFVVINEKHIYEVLLMGGVSKCWRDSLERESFVFLHKIFNELKNYFRVKKNKGGKTRYSDVEFQRMCT